MFASRCVAAVVVAGVLGAPKEFRRESVGFNVFCHGLGLRV